MSEPDTCEEPLARDRLARAGAVRFTRYSTLSLISVPLAFGLLFLASQLWDVNAGLLNVAVGTVLTPPSYWAHRRLVWPEGSGRSVAAEMFSFWKTVMTGTLAASMTMALLDALTELVTWEIFAAGLAVQGLVFVLRFFWLDRVIFARRGIVP